MKIFNDPIHGYLEMKPALTAIIDTPEFQRLRNLKQMGLTSFVYPGGTHTRFAHSLGVSHLAGKLLRAIKENQPDLNMEEKDVLCVEIAGLCHDLGHGPFSHLFDGDFIPRATAGNPNPENWTHERGSLKIFDLMIKNNGLMERGGALKKEGLDEVDITFIKEQIFTKKIQNKGFEGRNGEKMFLYEIIANSKTNIDVDKWDYLARDCFHLGLTNSFSEKRLMKYARVLEDGDHEWQICLRDKVVNDLYEMFTTRYKIFHSVIHHRVKQALDIMMLDALLAANDHLALLWNDESIEGKKISDCINDMEMYTRLHDGIMYQILNSKHKELEKSRSIIQRMLRRDLYQMVVETEPFNPDEFQGLDEKRNYNGKEIKSQMKQNLKEDVLDTFEVEVCKYDFGMGKQNPLSKLKVYIASLGSGKILQIVIPT